MQSTVRLASPGVADRYPLPVHAAADWHAAAKGIWVTSVPVGQVPTAHIITPSFAMRTSAQTPYAFRCVLQSTSTSALAAVPAEAAKAFTALSGDQAGQSAATSSEVSTHIDCWHTEQPLEQTEIRFEVLSAAPPSDYLISLAVRPLQLQPPICPRLSLHTAEPLAISQMCADNKIRQRICSPTALAMALSVYPEPPGWQETVQACYDSATNAYGVWPLAIRWAAINGVVGAVETFADWDGPLQCLRAGVPLVCSIRFDKDALLDAPLNSTGGHLVLLYGIDDEQVLVMDPAAPANTEVPRRYDAQQFSKAWLERRGAAYVLSRSQVAAR